MLKNSLARVLEKIISPRLSCGKILELGPGKIWPSLNLVSQRVALDTIGIGYTIKEKAQALKRAGELEIKSRVKYYTEGLLKFPLREQSIDGVISFGALHAWERPQVIFDEVARVLKKGGVFFIGDANHDLNWLHKLLVNYSNTYYKEVYKKRITIKTIDKITQVLNTTNLPAFKVERYGPDIWITNCFNS